MKTTVKIFIFLFFLLYVITQVRADEVYLKNGRQIKGVIQQENDEYLELEVESGAIKFYRQDILRVERSSRDENQVMKGIWQEGRLRKEELKARRQQEEESRPKKAEARSDGNHLFVNALLNKKVDARLLVDTGASMVVLSPEIVQKLNINIEKKNIPPMKIILADGREISGKYFKLNNISIGEANAEGVDAAVIFEKNAFTDFDGILGMSFLKFFKFEINLKENKLILSKQ